METRAAVPGRNYELARNFLSDPIVSFEGLHVGELVHGNCSRAGVASDDSGAVGFDHYVQVVNTAVAVYDKQGNMVAGPVSSTRFWENQPDCGGFVGDYATDAVVRFDRYANRWIISVPGWGLKGGNLGDGLCVAISQTSDPTGRYDQYAFEVKQCRQWAVRVFQRLSEN
jgi:hypothetical protein